MQFLLAILALATTAHADQPGFLKDFNYQVTQLKTMGQAQALENAMSTDTRLYSICANRAHFWANDLARKKNVQVGKVFIHFTAAGEADEDVSWAYHVAPYVIVNGKEMVLDPVFAAFNKKPVELSEWTNHFGKSPNCVELDPLNNPDHLKLEQNNVGFDNVTPLSPKTGNARQYPSTEGYCYIRKVPMYYQYPSEIYGADLFKSGKPEFSVFDYQDFQENSVLNACQQAMNVKFKMEHSCFDYLGLKKKPGILQKLLQDDIF